MRLFYLNRISLSVTKILILFLIFLIPALSMEAAGIETGSEATSSNFYHDFASLTQVLKGLAAQKPQIAKLTSIGKSLQGKDLWMLEISGTQGKPKGEKQALLICANLEGDHIIGSEVALGIANYLIGQYGQDEKVTSLLDKRTFYIIPRANPDGAELFFAKIQKDHQGNLKARDDDYDWLLDEDGPEDLNQDGMITMMRVKDKEGEWYIDKKDPRLMKKKDADTSLDSLYKLYPEGIDNDGDELYNEDGAGGFNINRNFPHNFGYKPKGLGVYPTSENETVAVIDFMTKYVAKLKTQPHRNICGVLIFSKYDNLAAGTGIECGTPTFPEPPQAEQAPAAGMRMFFRMGSRRGAQAAPQAPPRDPQPKKTETKDNPIFKSTSDKYKEITGIKNAVSEKPVGSMLEWAYFQFGVPAFSANLWSLREESGQTPPAKKRAPSAKPDSTADRRAMFQQMAARAGRGATQGQGAAQSKSGNDEKWLKWIDEKNGGKGFVNWTKFKHKQLGEVEIGGFQPYLRINPPPEKIPELSESHAKFVLHLAAQFAEITMDSPQVEKLSSDIFQLKIKLHNSGQFPYSTAMGQRTRNITPIVLRLKFEDDDDMKLFGGSKRIDLSNLDPGAEKEYKWIIISSPGKKIDITMWARNGGGTTKKTVVLN